MSMYKINQAQRKNVKGGSAVSSIYSALVLLAACASHAQQATPIEEEPVNKQTPQTELDVYSMESHNLRAAFAEVDENQDKSVSWEEVRVAYRADLQGLDWEDKTVFQSYDHNKDKTLNYGEFSFFHQAMLSEMERNKVNTVAGVEEKGVDIKPTSKPIIVLDAQDKAPSTMMWVDKESQSEEKKLQTQEKMEQNPPDYADNQPSVRPESKASAESRDALTQQKADSLSEMMERNAVATQNERLSEGKPVIDAFGALIVPKEALESRKVINLSGEYIGSVDELVFIENSMEKTELKGVVVRVDQGQGASNRDVFVAAHQLRMHPLGKMLIWRTQQGTNDMQSMPEYRASL